MIEGIFTMMGAVGCLLLLLAIIAFVGYWVFMGLMIIIGGLLTLWDHIKNK